MSAAAAAITQGTSTEKLQEETITNARKTREKQAVW